MYISFSVLNGPPPIVTTTPTSACGRLELRAAIPWYNESGNNGFGREGPVMEPTVVQIKKNGDGFGLYLFMTLTSLLSSLLIQVLTVPMPK